MTATDERYIIKIYNSTQMYNAYEYLFLIFYTFMSII